MLALLLNNIEHDKLEKLQSHINAEISRRNDTDQNMVMLAKLSLSELSELKGDIDNRLRFKSATLESDQSTDCKDIFDDPPTFITKDGIKEWSDENGKLHRDNDKPARICANGTRAWYKHGDLHRDNDLPAVIYANGTQEWYQNGKCHRDNDLPAKIYASGTQMWCQNGEVYRDNDKPSIICANGTQSWWQHGKLHRDNNQPAVTYADGGREWYLHGTLIKSMNKL